MKLKVLQQSSASINSVYIFNNFLDNTDYLNHLTNKISIYTETDEMNKTTNVKASMTNYKKLLEDSDFNHIHHKIVETLLTIWTLRVPNPDQPTRISITESWGMKHKKGDFTKPHIHNVCFSGAFYFKVPCLTTMWLEEYYQGVDLEDNMLILFPGFTKHAVFEHTGEEDRISMAFNINIET